MSAAMTYAYPIMLDVRSARIVIVGGGTVACRKARSLLAAGASDITCVAPRFSSRLPPGIRRVCQEFRPHHLRGASLVFAATDSPQVNQSVVRESRRRRIPVNRADADAADSGDFTVPAVYRRGPLTIAVSAGGSPALAAAVRDDIARLLDPVWARMALALRGLRPRIRECSALNSRQRRRLLRDLAGPEALAILRQGGLKALRRWLGDRLPPL